MKINKYELQEAIYARLNGNLDGNYPVYGDVPENPYAGGSYFVELGDKSAVYFGGKRCPGMEVTFTIHVWGRCNTDREIEAIKSNILELITTSNSPTTNLLTMDSFYCVQQLYASDDTFSDADPEVRHGVLLIDFKLQQK